MTDFSHLLQQETKQKDQAVYTFYELEGNPELDVRPATESNSSYFNALLTMQAQQRRGFRRRSLKVEDLQRSRQQDTQLYSKHVIVGWRKVVDADGKEVTFNETECVQFLQALPDWVLDDLRNFCAEPTSFHESVDAEEIAKN